MLCVYLLSNAKKKKTMKTMIDTNRTHRVLTTMLILTMVAATSYGQGMLIEGAAKLFNSLRKTEKTMEFAAVQANYIPTIEAEGDSFRLNTRVSIFDRNRNELSEEVILSFHINNLEMAYENEISTESWMTETFSNELEVAGAVEPWMTETFSAELEVAEAVEPWMTESLYSELEAGVEVEEWMTTPLQDFAFEEELETENWMSEPLVYEQEIATEDWMLERFESGTSETELVVEDWMTTPVYASTEGSLEVEGWMEQPLR
jgi:hypothetical protein